MIYNYYDSDAVSKGRVKALSILFSESKSFVIYMDKNNLPAYMENLYLGIMKKFYILWKRYNIL